IVGAFVRGDDRGESASDSQGRCALAVRPGLKQLRLTAEKEGYEPSHLDVDLSHAKSPVYLRLRAVQPPRRGMVWVNLPTGIYHYEGDRWYGTTKHGQYMTEADAIRAGYRAAKR